MTDFETFWRRHFGDFPPSPPEFPSWENWVRFHYLPQSKQYADSAEERATAIHRYASVANEVLGIDAPCWLSAVSWPETDLAKDEMREIAKVIKPITLEYAGVFPDVGEFIEQGYEFEIHAARVTWRLEHFEELLGLIAEGEIEGNATWTRIDKPVIFYPYNGGMDLYLRSPGDVTNLKQRFSDWLSPRRDGL